MNKEGSTEKSTLFKIIGLHTYTHNLESIISMETAGGPHPTHCVRTRMIAISVRLFVSWTCGHMQRLHTSVKFDMLASSHIFTFSDQFPMMQQVDGSALKPKWCISQKHTLSYRILCIWELNLSELIMLSIPRASLEGLQFLSLFFFEDKRSS